MKHKSVVWKTDGFTLLEILVALIIFSLASIFIVSLTASALDKPKQAGVLSDFNNYESTGKLVLKEVGNTETEEGLTALLNEKLSSDKRFTAGVSSKKSPYNNPYKIQVSKISDQTQLTITTEGKKEGKGYKLVVLLEGKTVESCTKGFGKTDKKLKTLVSDACSGGEDTGNGNGEEVATPSIPEVVFPDFTPTTTVPNGCTGLYTALDVYNIRNNLSGCFIQMNDIDLSSYLNWTPIGKGVSGSKFTGTFDGQRFTISKLTSYKFSSDYVGLFGAMQDATIQNVVLKDVSIIARNYVGGLVGAADSGSTIENIIIDGDISAMSDPTYTGGVVGNLVSSSIKNVKSTISVSGDNVVGGVVGESSNSTITSIIYSGAILGFYDNTGGIVGYATDSSIEDVYSEGVINAGSNTAGGIVGYMKNTSLLNSASDAEVAPGGYGRNVGGLVGYAEATSLIQDSFATGSVAGYNSIGGLVGAAKMSVIENSFANGDVTGTHEIGGLIGHAEGMTKLNKLYATGLVSGGDNLGGLIGYLTGSLSNSYATGDVVGNDHSAGTAFGYGGLVGIAKGDGVSLSAIEKSYSTGNVLGETMGSAGGFAGVLSDINIKDSYATGNVDTYFPTVYTLAFTGGFVGSTSNVTMTSVYATGSAKGNGVVRGFAGSSEDAVTLTNVFYNKDASPSLVEPKATPKTSEELKKKETFTNWNFNTIWEISEGVSYPTLR